MSQLLYITGQVTQKGALRQSESNPDTSYLRLILQESTGNKNELPMIAFNKRAEETNSQVEVGTYILAECRVSSTKNVKDGKTWYNISLIVNEIKVLVKNTEIKKITKSTLRGVAKNSLIGQNKSKQNMNLKSSVKPQSDKSLEAFKDMDINAHNGNKSVMKSTDIDTFNNNLSTTFQENDNTKSNNDENNENDDEFDDTLFDFDD